jgi:peptidoglycan/xylan/chitin deacetylase (PgdA/CDA1 family)
MTRRALLAAAASAAAPGAAAPFRWPEGKRAAVSLTFDDARLSQVDVGLPLFEKLGAPATFYVLPRSVEKRLDGWKKMVAFGHEIGNHSVAHPCTANYKFTAGLEDYTLERMDAELVEANSLVRAQLGVTPVSFAYPCGNKFVGRGVDVRSYVPVVARRFQSGRGYLDESANAPDVCDLAQLMGTHFDGLTFAQMKVHLDKAAKDGRWVAFAGHEIGKAAAQTTDTGALTELVAYLKDPANGFWLDTVANIAAYVKRSRG